MTTTAAYASLEEFLRGWDQAPSSSSYPRIEDALADATAQITEVVGWDFWSHPTTTLVIAGTGTPKICVHKGIVSLTSVALASGPDLNYQVLTANDWYLAPDYPEPEEPYDHVMLADRGGWRWTPRGQRRVRLIGTIGYAAVPRAVRTATIALARQLFSSRQAIGAMAGPAEYSGTFTPAGAMVPRGWPEETYRVVEFYRHKFFCHVGNPAAMR